MLLKHQTTTTPVQSHHPRILIVEDDVTLRPFWSYIIDTVSPEAYVVWVTTEEAAENMIQRRFEKTERFDLVITDVFLSGHRTGIDLWKRFGEEGPSFLLMSVLSPTKLAKMVGEDVATPFYLQKPLDPKACIEAVRALLSFHSSTD